MSETRTPEREWRFYIDDERSEAALNALTDLSRKTQVILFTHHSRVVEQASGLSCPAQVHELE